MKKIAILLTLLGFTCSGFTQSLIKNENLPDFTAISLSGNMNVEIIPAAENVIEVELYDSDVKKLTWNFSNDGTLSVTLRPTVGQKARADVRIYYKNTLRNISVSNAKLTANDKIVSPVFNLSVSGGGNASIALDSEDAEIDVSANSVLKATGTAKYLSVRATEKSKADTRKLNAVSAEAEAVTGGEIYVYASERIVVNARNASNIYYAGNPTIVRNHTSKASIGSGVYDIGSKK